MMYQNALVADLIDGYSVVVNVGSRDLVRPGAKCIIYAIGKEIFDPVTKESLGKLEVIKGEGKISSIQERMSIIESAKRPTHQSNPFIEGILNKELEPFSKVKVGDLVRIAM